MSKPYTPRHKRICHIEAEARRRQKINNGIKQLSLVSNVPWELKLNRISLLNFATQLLKNNCSEIDGLSLRIDRLKQELAQQKSKIAAMQTLLPTADSGPRKHYRVDEKIYPIDSIKSFVFSNMMNNFFNDYMNNFYSPWDYIKINLSNWVTYNMNISSMNRESMNVLTKVVSFTKFCGFSCNCDEELIYKNSEKRERDDDFHGKRFGMRAL